MKNVMKLKEKFIEECNKKLLSKKIEIKDVLKSTGLSDSTVNDFFENKSDTKISTVIKNLNAMNQELKIK